jgi:hypothetical protein
MGGGLSMVWEDKDYSYGIKFWKTRKTKKKILWK